MCCFPIVVAEGLDVNFYMSLSSLLSAVECVDVINNEYQAYDATGNRVILSVVDNQVVARVDYKINLKAELEKLLINFLKAIEIEFEDDEKDLSNLLGQCIQFYIQ